MIKINFIYDHLDRVCLISVAKYPFKRKGSDNPYNGIDYAVDQLEKIRQLS